MNVLSDILCDTSSLLASQNFKPSSSENCFIPSQQMFVRQENLNLLESTTHISTIGRAIAPVDSHSSQSTIDLFSSSDPINIAHNVDNAEFGDRSESVFSDSFAEIVPSWLTHDFMKVSDNLTSPNILSNVSDIYSSTQEDEHLEMLDLGFTPDLTTGDLNRNCISSNQKILDDLPMQQYSNGEPMLLSSLNDINVSQMRMPLKNNIQFSNFKSNGQISKSSDLMSPVLQCNNNLVHLPIHSNLSSQCLTINSSPSLLSNSQNHNQVSSVCDKLPQININQLNTFLQDDISDIHILQQNFQDFNIPEGNLSHSDKGLSSCQPSNLNASGTNAPLSTTKNLILKPTQDASIQVSRSENHIVKTCVSCSKVDSSGEIEEIQCFKCKQCDFISIHKCIVQEHSSSHSKSLNVLNEATIDMGSNMENQTLSVPHTSQNSFLASNDIVNTATLLPLNSHLNNSILSIESTYIQNENQVISKSNFLSGQNITAPVQLSISESVPISYQLIPISEVVLNPASSNDTVHINNNLQYLVNDSSAKQRPILKKAHVEEKPTESKKCSSKSNKDEANPDKHVSAQKMGWRKKIRRELGSYICEYKGCNVRFKALDNLEYHRKCHISEGSSFACPECGLSFNNWRTISGHLWRSHSNDMELHACDKCSYKHYSLSRLENYHKKTHLEECLFLCDICGKKFKNRKQLRNHRVIHNKNRKVGKQTSFTCRLCLTNFTTKHLLRNHQELIHNQKSKVHSCSFCDYSTNRKSTMLLHIRQHTGEKPFHCDKCDYKTSDHNSLRRHKMIHSGEKVYKCPYCSYSSIQSNTYKDHLKNKHPGQDIVYSCKLCPFRTVKFENFRVHNEEHENDYKHKQLHQINESNSNEEMLPLIKAMGIRLSNSDSLGYLSYGVNN